MKSTIATADRAKKILSIAKKMARKIDKVYGTKIAEQRMKGIKFHENYSDSELFASAGIIAVGNWSTFKINGKVCNLAERLEAIFGKMGIACERKGEWYVCSSCDSLVKHDEDSGRHGGCFDCYGGRKDMMQEFMPQGQNGHGSSYGNPAMLQLRNIEMKDFGWR